MFTVMHPIRFKILNQSELIEFLISDFRHMQRLWNKKMGMTFRREAHEIAEGDSMIETSEYLQMLRQFDENREYEVSFYNAMLILVYSYYEDLMIVIHNTEFPEKLTDTAPRMSELCKNKGITLSNESKDNVDFIFNNVRLLRNYITHNKWGRYDNKPDEVEALKNLVVKYPEISYDESSIHISDTSFLLDGLRKEKSVLLELADKLGYNNKTK